MTAAARSSKLLPVAMAIFVLGLIALAAIVVLYLGGHHELPLWLNSSAGVLTPLGFGLALIGLLREARPSRRVQAAADSGSQSANSVKS